MLIFFLLFGISSSLKSILNDKTLKALFPENDKGDDIPLDSLDHLIQVGQIPPFIDMKELIQNIKFLESQIPTPDCHRDYPSELSWFIGVIKGISAPITLNSFRSAFTSHFVVSWPILSEENKVSLQKILSEIDVQLQSAFNLPTELLAEGFDLWNFGGLNLSYVKIEPQGRFKCVESLDRNDASGSKPYFFQTMQSFVRRNIKSKIPLSQDRGVAAKCRNAEISEFFKFFDGVNENFEKFLTLMADVSTMCDWTNAGRKLNGSKSSSYGEMKNLDYSTSALLGKFPHCPEPHNTAQLLGTFFYHFRLIHKHLELHERRKQTYVVPTNLDQFITGILKSGVNVVDDTGHFLVSESHLDGRMRMELYTSLLQKLERVKALPSSNNPKRRFSASSFFPFSVDFLMISKSLTPSRVILENQLFDLMFHYFSTKNPNIDLVNSLLEYANSKVDQILSVYSSDFLDHQQVKTYLMFFLFTSYTFKRPLGSLFLSNRREKWNLYYTIVKKLTDPILAESMMNALKFEFIRSGESYEDVQKLLSSFSFLDSLFNFHAF